MGVPGGVRAGSPVPHPPGQRQAPQRGLRLVLQHGRLAPGVNVNGAELLGETLRFSL